MIVEIQGLPELHRRLQPQRFLTVAQGVVETSARAADEEASHLGYSTRLTIETGRLTRRTGKAPPARVLLPWMQAKGISRRLLGVVQEAIKAGTAKAATTIERAGEQAAQRAIPAAERRIESEWERG